MSQPTTTTYALLGLLAIRPWTGYELTRQARRSLRYTWPRSEANLYHQQRRLVGLGWATITEEAVGQRSRNCYEITKEGRTALATWLATEPGPPHLEIEGIVRLFFADQGVVGDLVQSLTATAEAARLDLATMIGFVDEYLETGGPFPERLHLISLAVELVTDLLAAIETFATETAAEVARWSTTRDLGLTPATRTRLERIRRRHSGHRPTEPVGSLRCVVVDVGDLAVAEDFWSTLTGLEVRYSSFDDRYSRLGTIEDRSVLLQLVPETKDGGKNRVHADITVDNVEVAIERVLAMGGKLVTASTPYPPASPRLEAAVMADPFGNEFCLVHEFPPEGG